MPAWAQVALGVAAVLTALGVIWKRLVKPLAIVISESEQTIPVMREFTAVFNGTKGAFAVLKEIAGQFRSHDGGSSLRDVIDSIEEAVTKALVVTEELRQAQNVQKVQAKDDREQLRHAISQLAVLTSKVNEGLEQNKQMAVANAIVARDLADSKSQANE